MHMSSSAINGASQATTFESRRHQLKNTTPHECMSANVQISLVRCFILLHSYHQAVPVVAGRHSPLALYPRSNLIKPYLSNAAKTGQ